MSEMTELTLCLVAVLAVGGPLWLVFVDRCLDAMRSHVVEIVKTKDEAEAVK